MQLEDEIKEHLVYGCWNPSFIGFIQCDNCFRRGALQRNGTTPTKTYEK